MIDVDALSRLFDLLYQLFVYALMPLASVLLFYLGFSNINNGSSMSGQAGSSVYLRKGIVYLGFSFFLAYFMFSVNAIGSDLISDEVSFSWTPINQESLSGIGLLKAFMYQIFKIFGICLLFGAAFVAPGAAEGKESAGKVILMIVVGIISIFLESFLGGAQELFIFNPLTLLITKP